MAKDDPAQPRYHSPPGIWKEECAIELKSGGFICTEAYPGKTTYLRVLDSDLHEIAYWTIDEVKEDPEDVIGAFFGAAKGAK